MQYLFDIWQEFATPLKKSTHCISLIEQKMPKLECFKADPASFILPLKI